jgi:hypothetical protein
VPAIPLKGPRLAERLYRDPALRPFTDLDLLVRRADVGRAVAALTARGYRHLAHERTLDYELRHANAACFVPAGRATWPVDLHWDLIGWSAGTGPRTLDADGVWDRAEPAARGGPATRVLAPDDLLLYLALHLAVHHPLDGLVWRLDLALLLRAHGAGLDWAGAVARARASDAASPLYFALASVQATLGAAAPPDALAALRPRGPRGAWLERLSRRRDARGRLDHLVEVALMDRGTDRLRALAAGVAPTPAWVRSRYATGSALRGYRAHYGRILGILRRT